MFAYSSTTTPPQVDSTTLRCRDPQYQSVQDKSQVEQLETTLLSESALARDWLAPEEDEAWQKKEMK